MPRGCAWQGGVHGSGVYMAGGMCGGGIHGRGMRGRGMCMAGGCVAGSVCVAGGCVVGSVCVAGGCVAGSVCVAGGCAWQGTCMAGETATAADGSQPTGWKAFLFQNDFRIPRSATLNKMYRRAQKSQEINFALSGQSLPHPPLPCCVH